MLPYGACKMCRQNNNEKCKWNDVCDSHNYFLYDQFKVEDILNKSMLKPSNNIGKELKWVLDNQEWAEFSSCFVNGPTFADLYRLNARKRKEQSDMKMPEIKNVKFNDPATIVFWSDGTKTVVKAGPNDIFDPEKGLAMAIVKKVYGNVGRYYNNIGKWVDKYYKEDAPAVEIKIPKETSFEIKWETSNIDAFKGIFF